LAAFLKSLDTVFKALGKSQINYKAAAEKED